MTRELARLLTTLLSKHIDERRTGGMCMGNLECEIMEDCFARGDFAQIETYIKKKLAPAESEDESKDERIRTIITDSVFYQYGAGVEYKDVLDYLDKLEKQKTIDKNMVEEMKKGFEQAMMWGRAGYKINPNGKAELLSQDEIDAVHEKLAENMEQMARSAASEWCRCWKCDGIINDTQSQCVKPNVTCLKWRDTYRAAKIALGKLKVAPGVEVKLELEEDRKPVEPSIDELQRYEEEFYNFKVFAAKQAKEYHISFIHDYEWNNFCAELLSYFNEKAEWSEEDEKCLQELMQHIEHCVAVYGAEQPEWQRWLNLLNSLRPQPKQEWTEEDEKILAAISKALGCDTAEKILENEGVTLMMAAGFLDSLRPQPKDEIYKGTDETYKLGKHHLAVKFMNYLNDNRPEGKMGLSNAECEDIDKAFKENDWAKIMRYVEKYKPHWKPSEEQLSALVAVFNDPNNIGSQTCQLALTDLYEQLKKLKEE